MGYSISIAFPSFHFLSFSLCLMSMFSLDIFKDRRRIGSWAPDKSGGRNLVNNDRTTPTPTKPAGRLRHLRKRGEHFESRKTSKQQYKVF
jgi:hypothetical protein